MPAKKTRQLNPPKKTSGHRHALSREEVINKLGSKVEEGLSSRETKSKLEKFGMNRWRRQKPPSCKWSLPS